MKEIICQGVAEEQRDCICHDTSPTKLSTTPQTVGATDGESCYDFLPAKEGKCSERVAWGSCSEAWMSEKFYCAVSCNLCDQQLSKNYACLPDFEDCQKSCGGEDNIQEFACFRQLKKSECVCSIEMQVKSASTSIFGSSGDCVDYLPSDEGTCANRLAWGSCKESWMREKNYCQKTCGFCKTSENTLKGDDTQLSVGLSRSSAGGSISVPIDFQNGGAYKNPTNTFQRASILQVLTFQDEKLTPTASSSSPSSNTQNIRQQFLDAHNEIRKAHCTRQLVWSAQLASEAEKLSKKCLGNTKYQNQYGENVYVSTSNNVDAAEALQNWYRASGSIRDYNNLPSDNDYYNSLYQVLWRQSSSVGCAIATQCGNTVVLCFYNPPAISNDWTKLYVNVDPPC
eukprot:TRINITY_DN4154_c0_g1_i3.p1 TRINITY_DN4154_c0_g1~~TRINITY_DN4154_c0_g1_i3.p1  ORF type:complete len:446 (-),score=70.91 TRINITY_DN4154_c0_g1_i3:193-1386(-)